MKFKTIISVMMITALVMFSGCDDERAGTDDMTESKWTNKVEKQERVGANTDLITLDDIEKLGFEEVVATIYDYTSQYYNIDEWNAPWTGNITVDGKAHVLNVLVFSAHPIPDGAKDKATDMNHEDGYLTKFIKNVSIGCPEEAPEVCDHVLDGLENN